MHNIDQILSELQRFSWADYIAFVAMFLLCIFIGIYFGFMKKSVSEDDYMLGGRKMLVLPIACSLVASFISGITLLGLPTEVYSYGTQYLYVSLGVVGMGITMGVFYLPVFHDLNITSTYEVRNSKDINIELLSNIVPHGDINSFIVSFFLCYICEYYFAFVYFLVFGGSFRSSTASLWFCDVCHYECL